MRPLLVSSLLRAIVPGATIISALVASSPSTSATVENFQMPRIERSSVAFRISWSPGRPAGGSAPCRCRRSTSGRFSSGYTPAVTNARMPAVCASASRMITPGSTGRCGKCPGKNGSLTVTFLSARIDLPGNALEHAVHEQEGIAMRQPAHHFVDVHRQRFGHPLALHSSSSSGRCVATPALRRSAGAPARASSSSRWKRAAFLRNRGVSSTGMPLE